MEPRCPQPENPKARLERERAAVERLARSDDARRLRALLQEESAQVNQAAQAAAQGSPEERMAIVDRLARSEEVANLLRRIEEQEKQAGLD